jgi:iron(III) transport system ATP-binding protein
MRFELKRLQRDLGITGIYVTHDQVEALAMSNRIAVMRDGKIQQIDHPRAVYERPASRFVADFIGTSNFIEGTVESRDGLTYVVHTDNGNLRVPSDQAYDVGAPVIVAARPEHIEIATRFNGEGPNVWRGRVEARAFLGEVVDHVVSVGSCEIRARCNSKVSIPAPTEVTVRFHEEAFSLIPGE